MAHIPKRPTGLAVAAILTLCLACPQITPIDPPCETDADCDDGLFCNGAERCSEGQCEAGAPPCELTSDSCPTCDEDRGECIVLECTSSADCDNGRFCDGAEVCADECICVEGNMPCDGACDNALGQCLAPSVVDDECDDGNRCTRNYCRSGLCRPYTRECSIKAPDGTPIEGAACNPTTGLCELPDGSDPCLTFCEGTIWGCIEPDIGQMDGFDVRREWWTALWRESMAWCDETEPWCSLVVGTCGDGNVFLFSIADHVMAEYFDPETGAFVGKIFPSDAIDPICCGITYWPRLIACEGAVVTEVLGGVAYEVGDSISLPQPRPGPCF